jgi:hypothetical protein
VFFFQFWKLVKLRLAHVRSVRRLGKHLPSILFQNFRYCTEAWRRALWRKRTPAAIVADLFCESLDAKYLAETFCIKRLLQWTPEALCCCHSLLVISHYRHEVNFRFLAATFFSAGKLHASTERTEISVVHQNLVSMFHLWQQLCSKTAHLLPRSAAAVLRPSCELPLFFAQLMRNHFAATFLFCNVWVTILEREAVDTFASCATSSHDLRRFSNRVLTITCVVRCCYWPPAFWVVLDAYPTFREGRCPPWHRAAIHYTIPANFI